MFQFSYQYKGNPTFQDTSLQFFFFTNGERKMLTRDALTKGIDMNWVLFETNVTSLECARNRELSLPQDLFSFERPFVKDIF